MPRQYVVTLVGPDQVGIVDRVTEKVLEFLGNVDESRMARLGGDFAIIMLVSTDEENGEAMADSLGTFQEEGFQVLFRPTADESSSRYLGWLPFQVTVTGADHEGIVNSVSHHLASKGINVEQMDTRTSAAPMSGTLLFTMSAIVIVPPQLAYHDWRDGLDEIADEMNVNIEVSNYTG